MQDQLRDLAERSVRALVAEVARYCPLPDDTEERERAAAEAEAAAAEAEAAPRRRRPRCRPSSPRRRRASRSCPRGSKGPSATRC